MTAHLINRVMRFLAPLTRAHGRVAAKVGRRGAFLILFGVVYLLLGFSYATTPVTPVMRTTLKLALNVAPLWVYGLMWLAAGTVAVISGAFLSPVRDAAGFVCAVIAPTLWAAVYLAAWVDHDAPRMWVAAALYAAVAGAVSVVSGMANPAVLDKVVEEDQP